MRLSLRGWLYSFAVAGIGMLLVRNALALSNELATSFRQRPGTVAIAVLALGAYLWLCLRYFFNRWKEWQLIRSGRFAKGRVLQQEQASRSFPWIVYGFRDAVGRESHRRVKDFTSSLYEEMPVSVFYNENDPSQSVALESSLFQIR